MYIEQPILSISFPVYCSLVQQCSQLCVAPLLSLYSLYSATTLYTDTILTLQCINIVSTPLLITSSLSLSLALSWVGQWMMY